MVGSQSCAYRSRYLNYLIASIFSVTLMVSAVDVSHAAESITDGSEHNSSALQETLRTLLATAQPLSGLPFKEDVSALRSFYSERNFDPAWTGSAPARDAAAKVLAAMADADKVGLYASQYVVNPPATGTSPPDADTAIFDLSITDTLLHYSTDLKAGLLHPKNVYSDVKLPKPDFNAAAAIASALKTNSIDVFLMDLMPAHPEYRRLVAGLVHYRNIAAHGGWPAVSGLQSDTDRKAALYSRLAMEDSGLPANGKPTDAQLQDAIKRYQTRNGLTPDGALHPELISELNVPVASRIQQILANLERWRWISAGFEDRYIAINVPDQTLEFVQAGRAVLTSRVIVGRRGSPTPILRTVANSLVANPPWDIPGDIAANQLLPHLRTDRNYLATHNMVIVNEPGDPRGSNIAWGNVSRSNFPYAIRQMPPYSALGVLMLDSPNKFDVYLHDTPGKRLFRNDDREISNGCVRVEQIMALASLALTNDPSAGRAQIESAISSHQTRRIILDNALPIYMLYWTAIADPDGNVGFRSDRYRRDPPLIEALNKRIRVTKTKAGE